jgi:small subunit ribosomal protein S20
MRQDVVRRTRNRSTKASLRTLVRKVREAIAAKKVDDAKKEFAVLAKKLDRASAQKVIHTNAAARTKSRLSHAIKALKA